MTQSGGRIERWFHGMRLHREDGPAIVEYFPSGAVRYEKWFRLDDASRVGGPAITHFHEDGRVKEELHYLNGRLHRIDGPASVEHDGEREPCWYIDGMPVRTPERAARTLNSWTVKRLRSEFGHSSYRALLREKVSPRRIVEVLGEGVATVEGIRAVVNGAPVEWVRAFEAGQAGATDPS